MSERTMVDNKDLAKKLGVKILVTQKGAKNGLDMPDSWWNEHKFAWSSNEIFVHHTFDINDPKLTAVIVLSSCKWSPHQDDETETRNIFNQIGDLYRYINTNKHLKTIVTNDIFDRMLNQFYCEICYIYQEREKDIL